MSVKHGAADAHASQPPLVAEADETAAVVSGCSNASAKARTSGMVRRTSRSLFVSDSRSAVAFSITAVYCGSDAYAISGASGAIPCVATSARMYARKSS